MVPFWFVIGISDLQMLGFPLGFPAKKSAESLRVEYTLNSLNGFPVAHHWSYSSSGEKKPVMQWDLSQPYKPCHGANQQTQCHKPFGLLKNVISHTCIIMYLFFGQQHWWLCPMYFLRKKNRYHPSGSSGVLQKQWWSLVEVNSMAVNSLDLQGWSFFGINEFSMLKSWESNFESKSVTSIRTLVIWGPKRTTLTHCIQEVSAVSPKQGKTPCRRICNEKQTLDESVPCHHNSAVINIGSWG